MLRANSKNFTEIIHFIKDTKIEDWCRACSCLDQTSEHGNSCSFTSSIVSKQSEYLSVIHGDIWVFDSNFRPELSPQASNLKAFICLFLPSDGLRYRFEVLRICLRDLHLFIIFTIVKQAFTFVLFSLILHSSPFLLGTPEPFCAHEVPFLGNSKLWLQDLI